MTNVFISWSGDLSQKLGEELRIWIPSVLQFAKPYFTPQDVEKGSKWGSEISKKLSDSHVGVICLTRENIQRPWILFEAGALSKDLEQSRICSVLFGIENTDVSGPLTTFQTTTFGKSDFKKLISTINEAGGDQKLDKDTFDRVFDKWWPDLEAKVGGILKSNATDNGNEIRNDRDILEEILSLSRISATRGLASRTKGLPAVVVDHLQDLANRAFNEAENHSDMDLLELGNELTEISKFISGHIDAGHDGAVRRFKDLSSRYKALSTHISRAKSSNLDDEIPF